MTRLTSLCLTFAATQAASMAQEPLVQIPAPAGASGYGKHVVGLDDLDGDGTREFAVADRVGVTRIYSGASLAVVATHDFGYPAVAGLAAIDVTGDGVRELIIGRATPIQNSNYGLNVIEPLTGTVLHSYGDFNFSGGDELRLAPAGDHDGDGLEDIILGTTNNDPWHPADWQSSVSVISTAAQFPVWSRRQWVHRMGEGVGSIGDLDGDGRREIVLTRPLHLSEVGGIHLGDRGTVELYTQAFSHGQPYEWRAEGALPGAELGEALAVISDVNSDSFEDLVTVESVPASPGGPHTTLRVRVLSGATGVEHAHHDFPREAYPGDLYEVELCTLSDVDGDGIEEVALISPAASAAGSAPESPALRILSGRTLEVLQAWSQGAAAFSGGGEHIEVAAGPDLDGDGIDDLLVGAPDAGGGGTLFVLPVKLSIGAFQCDAAVANSTGRVAHVSLSGDRFVTENDVTMTVSDLPPGAFALPVAARLGGSFPMAGGGEGTLCLSGSIVRLNLHIGAASAAGILQRRIDLDTWAGDFGVPPVVAGERWHFQVWHRDIGVAGPSSNFSDARVVLLR